MREEVEKVRSKGTDLEKQIAQEEANADRAAHTGNKKLTETAGTIVEQRTCGRFCDLSIRYERPEKKLESVEAESERSEEMIKSQGGKENAKLKKYGSQTTSLREQNAELEKKTTALKGNSKD